MPLAPFIHRWRILAAAGLLLAAVASPALAQGPRNSLVYVLMGDNYFLPASITVQGRTTVVWMNQGQMPHSVVSAMWNSGLLLPGQAFWRTFDVPGEYWFTDPTYVDVGMNGYVTVQGELPVVTRTPLPPPPPPPPPPPGGPGPGGPGPAGPGGPAPAGPAGPGGPAPAGPAGPAPSGPGGAAGTTPAPAVSPQLASTPASQASPAPGGPGAASTP